MGSYSSATEEADLGMQFAHQQAIDMRRTSINIEVYNYTPCLCLFFMPILKIVRKIVVAISKG